jgi:hypothetical protein
LKADIQELAFTLGNKTIVNLYGMLSFSLTYNVKTLGEEADLEAQTFSLAQKPI